MKMDRINEVLDLYLGEPGVSIEEAKRLINMTDQEKIVWYDKLIADVPDGIPL